MTLRLSEKSVTEQIIGYLRAERWNPIRLNSGLIATPDGRRMRIGQKGLPDWICVRGTEYVFVEMKGTGKKLQPEQETWFQMAQREGFPAIWANGLGMFMEKYSKLFGVRAA